MLPLTCLIEFKTLLEKRIKYGITYYSGRKENETNKREDGDFLGIAIDKCQPIEPCVSLLINQIYRFLIGSIKCEKDILDGMSDFDYIFHQSEKFKKLLEGYKLIEMGWSPLKKADQPMLFYFKKS